MQWLNYVVILFVCFTHGSNGSCEIIRKMHERVVVDGCGKSGIMYSSFLYAAAATTYFCSVSGTERLKSSGKYSSKCVRQKRRNRIMRVHNFNE